MWTARRILKELADSDRRRAILTHFFRHAEQQHRMVVQMHLARAMNFREETLRKMPPEKKADLLAQRMGTPEFEQFIEMALMHYHTNEKNGMMGAFLDQWKVPHENGSIENDDYTPPTADQVREAVKALGEAYDPKDVRIYLATAGLLMGDAWREGTWPVVDDMNQ
ncbi:MAG TPA: hypothetical protein VGQ76_06615 [Thermoanaerobaculia bacterium]|jgi:hypothetical protein|nr:hypothetical protein [Thermoanaerobaculia bacterium]